MVVHLYCNVRRLIFMMVALLLSGVAAAQKTVSFPTEDAGVVYANVFGEGDRAVLPSGICEKRARRPWRWWEPAWEERLLAMRRSPRHRARSTAWFYSARAPGGQAEITQFAHRGTRRRERGWPASTRDSRAIQKSA